MTMNVNAEPGSKVVFLYPWNGYNHDTERAMKYLKVGETYTVRDIYGGQSTTGVSLQETPDITFNSVMFENADSIPALADYIRLLEPSVEHSDGWRQSPKPKAHAAAMVWLATRLEGQETDSAKAARSRAHYEATKEVIRAERPPEPLAGEQQSHDMTVTIQPCHKCGRVHERMVLNNQVTAGTGYRWLCEGRCRP